MLEDQDTARRESVYEWLSPGVRRIYGKKLLAQLSKMFGDPQRGLSRVPDVIAPQPPPEPAATRPVWSLVIEDMQARDQWGREKYGTPLQADNGRDHLIDLYQELLDAVVYVRAEIEKRAEAERRKA